MKVKAIILGAGQGKRMGSDLPKVLHPICGKPMIRILLDSVHQSDIHDITVVVGPHMDNVAQVVKPAQTVVQMDRLGTAHAVLTAKKVLKPFRGCILVLFGDTPLILPETLNKMIADYQSGADIVVLGFMPSDARRYGRLVMGQNGLDKIVEYKDATDEQRAIRLCNSGVMCLNGEKALGLLKQIKNNNVAGEYYLTDIVAIARQEGLKCSVVIGNAEELHGVNTPEELETAQEIYMRQSERRKS
ncbi:MAG: NTP transferase domain-containing protein [Pseudomonadota bacterium]|nr:NTP transferase domain-containing protein [Pseudomonadota bacterium]